MNMFGVEHTRYSILHRRRSLIVEHSSELMALNNGALVWTVVTEAARRCASGKKGPH